MPRLLIPFIAHNRIVACLVLVVAVLAGVLGGQPTEAQEPLRLRHYGVRDGMAQAFVHVTLQDSYGFIWFGTQGGLNRFDGHEFKIYSRVSGQAGSLPADPVKAILESADNTLWIGTEGGGLSHLDRARDEFVSYRHDPSNPQSIPSDRVRVLLEDSQGRFWVGMDDRGVALFDQRDGTFRSLGVEALESASARAILESREGGVWIGFEGAGLVHFDASGRLQEHLTAQNSFLPSNNVRSLVEDDLGNLWIGTTGDGLVELSPDGTVRHHLENPEDPTSLPSNEIYAIFQDQSGTMWFGTNKGLSRLLGDGKFYTDTKRTSDLSSLPHERVGSIYQDRGGVLWIGTYGGLSLWNPRSATFKTYRHTAGEQAGLSDNFVASFAEDPSGQVWVGTYGGGLNLLDPETDTFLDAGLPSGAVPDDRIMSLLYDDRSGNLLLGTFSSGLGVLNPGTGRVQTFQHDPGDPTSISANSVTSIIQRSDGSIWLGSFHGGVSRFDLESGTFARFRHDAEDEQSISSDRVVALFEDRQGHLWVGTYGGGLNLYDDASSTFRTYRSHADDPTSLSSDTPWGFAQNEDGDLWIATQDGGLSRWRADRLDRLDPIFERYTERNALESDSVYGILIDSQQRLWLSSDRGITRFDPENGRTEHYNSSHGLQGDEFNHAAQLRTQSGRFYFGGVEGFSSFEPEADRKNDIPPSVVLTNVLKTDKPIEPSVPLADLRHLDLGYQDDVITFEFAALDFAAPEANRYRYMLEGFRDEWIALEGHRRVTFTNLDRGNYTFRVQGSNSDGVWSPHGIALEMAVGGPPWTSRWAFLLYGLATVAALRRYFLGQRRKRLHALELESTNLSLTDEILERKRKERALQQEKRKVQQYLDVAEVIVVLLDSDGRVRTINQKGCSVLGRESQEVEGQLLTEFVPSAQQPTLAHQLVPYRDGGSFECQVTTGTNELRDVVWRTATLEATDGTKGRLFSGLDITQMRSLAEARDLAESANRSKSRFLANMSHEIRTPMGGILGMIELLLRSSLKRDERRYAQTAQRAAQGLLDILNDVLDFSKIEAGKLEIELIEFDLGQTVGDVIDLFRRPAEEKDLQLTLDLADDLPTHVLGDPTRLRQVLSNLVGNAIKFTSEGDIGLRVGHKSSGGILFEVSDSGHGVPFEAQRRIFKPFDQADESITRQSGGTGLGLAISKQLVEMMDGEIHLKSQIGEGSVFSFVLPLAASAQMTDTATDDASPQRSKGLNLFHGRKIMLVEDNSVMREVAEEMLTLLGADTATARNGQEAVNRVQSERFDLVLMDCQMPVLDGYGATRAIRSLVSTDEQERLPIVAMTANAMAGDREKCLAAGMDDYLSKPFSIDQLSASLSRWLTPKETRLVTPSDPPPSSATQREVAGVDAALEELRKINESPEFLDRIVERYVRSSNELIERFAAALENQSLKQLGAAAHTLKSSAAMMGGFELAELCRDLEQQSETASDATEVISLVEAIQTEGSRMNSLLQERLRSAA